MSLFERNRPSRDADSPKRAKRVYLAEVLGDLPSSPSYRPKAEDGRLLYPHGREQPEKGPIVFSCPWAMTGVDRMGMAHIYHFQLLAKSTPIEEVKKSALARAAQMGWHRIRVINLNTSELKR